MQEVTHFLTLQVIQRVSVSLFPQSVVQLRKRVALADAMLLRPRVLLLDDFLSGLDFDMRQTAGEILSNAAAFSSVVVTGHELWDFAKWTTRFLILRDGVIASKVDTAGLDSETLRERVETLLQEGDR